MKLYRSIALNEGDKINTENMGNSWTLCDIFAEDHFKDYNNFAQKDGYVILSIDIDMKDVDIDNTLFAMENREFEYEVVINNVDVVAEIHDTDLETFENVESIEGNTGENNFEYYCENYEGELTIEELKELINEF